MSLSFLRTFIREGWPPKSSFSVEDIPDLSGQVVIITGANSGIGKETAKALLQHNAKVYFACRDKRRTKECIDELKTETGNAGHFLELDLASLVSVRAAVEEFSTKEKRLDILINNAMLMWTPLEETTVEGYDKQFGIGVVGHFHFTKLLLPVLLSSGTRETPSRVLHVSSIGHLLTAGLQFDAFKDGPYRRKQVSPEEMYNEAKLATILFSNELAKRYGDQGIISVALNPGNIRTNLMRNTKPLQRAILYRIQYPVEMGAHNLLFAATTSDAASLNGKYVVPWARTASPSVVAQDEGIAKRLWDWLERELERIS